MKTLKDIIVERLHINKDIGNDNHEWYALLGVYHGYFYLVDKLGDDNMIIGDKGSGLNIFIVNYNTLIKLDYKHFGDNTISVFIIPEKYQDNLSKFEKDYYNGVINLEDDFEENNKDEINKLFKK